MTVLKGQFFSKLKLSLAIGVPKQKIDSFISILFGKGFRRNFQNTKAAYHAAFVFDRFQQIFTSYTNCGKIQLSELKRQLSFYACPSFVFCRSKIE